MSTPRKLHRLQALLGLGAAIIVPLIFIVASRGDRAGLLVSGLVCAVFLAYAGFHWFKHKNTPEDAVFYDITKQPPEEQIRMSTRAIWSSVLLGPLLSLWTYHQLIALETGSQQTATVWGPVALLYDLLGFWPAVLCWPVLCAFIVGLSFFRIEKAKSMLSSKEPNQPPHPTRPFGPRG